MLLKVAGLVIAVTAVLVAVFIDSLLPPVATVSSKTPNDLQPQYEYIIVGGGITGAILASRLSADPSVFVLLLDASVASPSFFMRLPYFNSLTRSNDPEQTDKLAVPLNSVWDMPNAAEWDKWATVEGVSEIWSWNNVKSSFVDGIHNQKDRLKVMSSEPTASVTKRLYEASRGHNFQAQEAPITSSPSSFGRVGLSLVRHLVTGNGKSISVTSLLTADVQSRFNLHIVRGAYVTKVSLNGDGEATGVDYLYDGRLQRVLINREVILCAGAIASPRLLMLSGIGDEKLLTSLQLPVFSNLLILGRSLARPATATVLYLVDGVCSRRELTFGLSLFRDLCNHLVKAGTIHMDCDAAERADLSAYLTFDEPDNDEADFYVNFVPRFVKEQPEKCAFEAHITLLHYYQKGAVTLLSANPMADASVHEEDNDKYLSHLAKAALRVNELLSRDYFARLRVSVDPEQGHGCPGRPTTEQYFECLLHSSPSADAAASPWSSSCPMGTDPSRSVVDKYLRVHGVKRIRVVDSSVLPSLAGGPALLSSSVALAQRAVEIILSQQK